MIDYNVVSFPRARLWEPEPLRPSSVAREAETDPHHNRITIISDTPGKVPQEYW